eukprot:m51a1_g9664 hypothetical protein (259) ;mRNA; r:1229558-1230387
MSAVIESLPDTPADRKESATEDSTEKVGERQRSLINFAAVTVGMVLVLNYTDLADPLADVNTQLLTSSAALCSDWNTYCSGGTQGLLLQCYRLEETILLNDSVPGAMTEFLQSSNASAGSLCWRYAAEVSSQQSTRGLVEWCRFHPNLGELFSGLFIAALLAMASGVFLPWFEVFHAQHAIESPLGTRATHLVVSAALMGICTGYAGMLSMWKECYDGKRVFLVFFWAITVMLFGDVVALCISIASIIRHRRTRVHCS